MKKINRLKIDYISEFVFFLVLYYAFGYFVLGLSGDKTLSFYMSLFLFGIMYSFVCSEIFVRNDFEYFIVQAVAIPILIVDRKSVV